MRTNKSDHQDFLGTLCKALFGALPRSIVMLMYQLKEILCFNFRSEIPRAQCPKPTDPIWVYDAPVGLQMAHHYLPPSTRTAKAVPFPRPIRPCRVFPVATGSYSTAGPLPVSRWSISHANRCYPPASYVGVLPRHPWAPTCRPDTS